MFNFRNKLSGAGLFGWSRSRKNYEVSAPAPGAVLFLKGRSRRRSHQKSGGSETLIYVKNKVTIKMHVTKTI